LSSEQKGPRYKIDKEIGRGAFGVVYLANDNLLRRKVALKVMSIPDGLNEEEKKHLVDRFYREARAAAGLSHPNIVTIHDISKAGDRHFISMELLEGAPLSELVDSDEPIPIARTVRIADEVLAALEYAHSGEVIHRDIKPDNIFLLEGDTVKLVDFGLARVQASTTITRSGTVMGSPGYIAPEVIDGKPADKRTDVFSFGVLFYEMLTGTRPFGPDTAFESFVRVIYRIMSEDPRPACEVNPDIPPGLQAVLDKMLAKDPDARYQDAGEARCALREAVAGLDLAYESGAAGKKKGRSAAPGATATAVAESAQTVSDGKKAVPGSEATDTEILDFESDMGGGGKKRRTGRIALAAAGAVLALGAVTVLILMLLGVFSSTDAKVPRVTNMSVSAATRKLEAAGLKKGKVTDVFAYDIARGKVAVQQPVAGRTVPRKSTVDLKVSMGNDIVQVPEAVVGMQVDQAASTLANFQLKAVVEQRFSEAVPVGYVFACEPAPGTILPYRSEVKLLVNSGVKPPAGQQQGTRPVLPRPQTTPVPPRQNN
jgi:hypothetical protein